jgi:hypothetical protein
MNWQPFGGIWWVSSSKKRITGKLSAFPWKNSFSEAKEITVASPFSSMLVFFRERGGRAMYWDRASDLRKQPPVMPEIGLE